MLTISERRVLEEYLEESNNTAVKRGHEFVSSALLAIGGALIVASCLLTVNNLSAETVKLVLLPGVLSGMAILLTGGYGSHYFSRVQKENDLASAIRKLVK